MGGCQPPAAAGPLAPLASVAHSAVTLRRPAAPELCHRARFNLSCALPRDAKPAADLCQGVLVVVPSPNRNRSTSFFPFLQLFERELELVRQLAAQRIVLGDTKLGSSRKFLRPVSSSSPERGTSSDTGKRAASRRSRTLLGHHLQPLGELVLGRLAAARFAKRLASTLEAAQGLDDVHGQSNSAAVVGHSAPDGLANPPRRVGREAESAPELEAIDGFHQADIAFLYQVEQREPRPR